MLLQSAAVGYKTFWPVLNNEQLVRRPGLTHEFQAIILMNARVLGNGSSLTASLQTDYYCQSSLLSAVFSGSFLEVFDAQ